MRINVVGRTEKSDYPQRGPQQNLQLNLELNNGHEHSLGRVLRQRFSHRFALDSELRRV